MPSLANVFNLNGPQVHISYGTGALGSLVGLTYQDDRQTLQFSPEDISVISTELGNEVTVTLHLTVDVGYTTFTLFIPKIALELNQQININTIGISCIHRLPFAPIIHGQLDNYTVVNLQGTAASLEFSAN